MSANKKRSFAEMLASSNTPAPTPVFTVPRVTVTNAKWSALSQNVVDQRAVVAKHRYKVASSGQTFSAEFSHTHGEFNKRVANTLSIGTHNISTSDLGSSPRSFPKIMQDLSTVTGATDALRVIKGTHLSKGLIGATPTQRRAAVELGAEIGVSEYTRGTTVALTDASINLYRMKHGNLSRDDFSDPDKGYTGAGKGGAERLRAVASIAAAFAPYDAPLKSIYDTHAALKPVRPWEAGLRAKATEQEKFDAWRAHKFQKWTQRE
ncbi:MAG: hypothetical protein NW204_00845 [Xanthomonadaceae bacterium]|nr:hypothetical protein [Xanthomonadaceae bacterium]